MGRLTDIKAVSFDADNTIFDFNKVMRHSLEVALAELADVDAGAAAGLSVDKMIAIRDEVAGEMAGQSVRLEDIRYQAFRRALEYAGRANDDLAAHLSKVYLKHRYQDIEIFDDALPVLKALRENYSVGMITNGNSRPEQCGLGDFFEFTVLADDHKVWKPDPRIFEIALEKTGCVSHEMVHVGDSLEDDVAGADSAGVRSVWLNRDGEPNDTEHNATREISTLANLLDIL